MVLYRVFIFFTLIVFSAISWSTYKKIASAAPHLPADLSGEIDPTQKIAVYEGKQIEVPALVFKTATLPVLGIFSGNRWIEVDLSEQKIKAWDGDRLFLESLISTGLPWWPTPKGEFTIWSKARATKMEGGSGKYYYYLPNVPYVMFFENEEIAGFRGFSLHGTYWHNDFGRVHSHGCVNLPTPVAEQLYFWTTPVNSEGKGFTSANEENPGTKIIIHE